MAGFHGHESRTVEFLYPSTFNERPKACELERMQVCHYWRSICAVADIAQITVAKTLKPILESELEVAAHADTVAKPWEPQELVRCGEFTMRPWSSPEVEH